MLNSFGSPLELGEDDNLALSLVDGSPPLLQVDDSAIVLRGLSPNGGPTGVNNPDNTHD